jgi:hypothetical protein
MSSRAAAVAGVTLSRQTVDNVPGTGSDVAVIAAVVIAVAAITVVTSATTIANITSFCTRVSLLPRTLLPPPPRCIPLSVVHLVLVQPDTFCNGVFYLHNQAKPASDNLDTAAVNSLRPFEARGDDTAVHNGRAAGMILEWHTTATATSSASVSRSTPSVVCIRHRPSTNIFRDETRGNIRINRKYESIRVNIQTHNAQDGVLVGH